jgi:hypothetical protein
MLNKEAKARFTFVVGNQTGEITVGGQAPQGKSEDDWKINLGLDAAAQIAEQFDTNIKVISISLVEFVPAE